MNAYIYRADIYCEDCAREIIARLTEPLEQQADAETLVAVEALEKALDIEVSDKTFDRIKALRVKKLVPNMEDESSYDSDEWPKGPYPDGGGEADCPQHCGACHEFLENPLTSDGYEYVRENQRGEWDDFYNVTRDEEADGEDAEGSVDEA